MTSPFAYVPFPVPAHERTRSLFINNPGVEIMPDIPDKVLSLMLAGCESMTAICETRLPRDLRDLVVIKCDQLTELPELPEGLKYLRVESCHLLTKLPSLPKSLYYLWLEDLPMLTQTEPVSVQKLCVRDCPNFE